MPKVTLLLSICILSAWAFFLFSMEQNLPSVENHDSLPRIQVPESDEDLPSHHVSAGKERAEAAEKRVKESLTAELTKLGLHWGDPIFIRVLKEEKTLEVFMKDRKSGKFILFRRYETAAMSGVLGPKLREGDFQVPEGFYYASASSMRPDSNFHLALNCGYPNAYDIAHQRTGTYIMIHGARASIGCVAMTDALIEEIYTLSAAALAGGQKLIRIHFFPFRMTADRMKREENNPWYPFWNNLKEGYDWFETQQIPPDAAVENKRYVFRNES